ncbi:MAG TPA: methionyl-tRNA formyltransferase [Candidatus Blautia avistercoris]|nr:methionyl-tRNA formyltransferase [Candidatus Blautia avistercoris]
MKLVFMGTPDFSVKALRALYDAGHEILAVYTQPDKPKGRGKSLKYPPVKEEALRLGLEVYQPPKVKDPQVIQRLRELAPQAIVVAAFGQIIPREILELPPYGCLNIHASLLPKYRGAAPIQWAVIDGEKESGVTIMKMNEGLDTGDMITKKVVPLEKEETGGSLFEKLSEAGAGLLTETLKSLEAGEAVYEKQPKESPTPYAKMISKEMGRIDWSRDAKEIERLVRGMNPWPSAYTYYKGKTVKIWKSRTESEETVQEKPGTIIRTDKEGIYTACGKGILCIQILQLEGKKRMETSAFLRGHAIENGESFSSVRE